jgi:hypothetical protein
VAVTVGRERERAKKEERAGRSDIWGKGANLIDPLYVDEVRPPELVGSLMHHHPWRPSTNRWQQDDWHRVLESAMKKFF